jgi:hypothetical protein
MVTEARTSSTKCPAKVTWSGSGDWLSLLAGMGLKEAFNSTISVPGGSSSRV